MTTVEIGNCWDPSLVDSITGGYDFDDLLNIFDFPMESIEETEPGCEANWDPQFLGPIPSNVLTLPPETKIDTGPPHLSPEPVTPSVPETKIAPPHFNSPVPARARSKRPRRATSNPWLRQFATAAFERPAFIKKCMHCEVTKTPQWREGPMGPKTLCNACGVRYRSGRLFPEYRPANSPTFVPSLHSNSHNRVIQMRNKNKGKGAMTSYVEEPAMSPEAEFVPMSSHFFDL